MFGAKLVFISLLAQTNAIYVVQTLFSDDACTTPVHWHANGYGPGCHQWYWSPAGGSPYFYGSLSIIGTGLYVKPTLTMFGGDSTCSGTGQELTPTIPINQCMDGPGGYKMYNTLTENPPALPQNAKLVVQGFYGVFAICSVGGKTMSSYEYGVAYTLDKCVPVDSTSSVMWTMDTSANNLVQHKYSSPYCTGTATTEPYPAKCANEINHGTFTTSSNTPAYPSFDDTHDFARAGMYTYTGFMDTTDSTPSGKKTKAPKSGKSVTTKNPVKAKAKGDTKAKL